MPTDLILLFAFLGTMCAVGYLVYRADMKKNSDDYWRK